MSIKIRKLLPGEERTYNDSTNARRCNDGVIQLIDEDNCWQAMVCAGGGTIVESTRPCSVRFDDGSRAAFKQALEEIAEADRVRHARSVARRVLREAGER